MFSSILSKLIIAAIGLALASHPALAAEVRLKLGQSKSVTVTAPDGSKAKVRLKFSGDKNGVMLEVKNGGRSQLTYKAVICLTKRNHCQATSTLPVGPRLLSFEFWPPGGDVLILSDFRFGP